ncbi:bifunctional diguanylate cyclase/phosphodiesterase [Aureimonas sp. AU12]|uniref:putative bifunctional diguanylate cyclase/phosphodiesterase n=1 Tax=Aureimonas sp. AU12 TaxID=1638161 RepID=UPI000B217399|nr:EAL domain-containing protein [Aureimonas sp. AU12]
MSIHHRDDLQSRLLIQSVTEYAIYMLTPEGYVASWNPGAERAKGYHADEIIGQHIACFYDEADRNAGRPERNLDAARLAGRFEEQGWRHRKDGSRFWANVVIDAIRVDGAVVGFAKVTRDCTEQREHALALAAMSANLRTVLSFSPHGTCLLDADLRIVLCNPAFAKMLKVDSGAAEGQGFADLLREPFEEAPKPAVLDLLQALRRDAGRDASHEIDWSGRILLVVARAAENGGMVLSLEDVTELRRSQSAVLRKVTHDALTDLQNRGALEARLGARFAGTSAFAPCWLLYIDLDRLKAVNDTHGHLAGDAILKETACRLSKGLRGGDCAYRVSGDEFIVLIEGAPAPDAVAGIARRLHATLAEPLEFEGRTLAMGCSIGIADSRAEDAAPSNVVDRADIALYQAKHDGRGCIRFHDEEMARSARKRRTLEMQLRRAMTEREFSLFYQPVTAADGAGIEGFEALIRWTQPGGAMVSPGDFIPLAEELGLMAEIGGWVFETACLEAATWPSHLTLAVNVSATQMQDPHLMERVRIALDKSGLDPRRLEVEITETAMITDHAQTLSILTELRAMGILVAIDDFGTGYSSLSFLQTLPFTRIKIDRSFVQDIASNSQSMAIVRGVMRISRDLGLQVTAEGVETQEQRDILLRESCQNLQGYLIARPMPVSDIKAFLSRTQGPAEAQVRAA